MNHLHRLLLSGGVLMLSFAANAQTWGQDPYYSQRNSPYSQGGRGGYYDSRYPPQRGYGSGGYQGDLVGRVLADLNRAASRAYLDGHEGRHFDEAAVKLQEFQERWARGRFDTGRLDKVINNLKHLADAERVHGQDREILARDIEELRQFRASRGGYFNNGYRDPYWR